MDADLKALYKDDIDFAALGEHDVDFKKQYGVRFLRSRCAIVTAPA